MDTMDKVSTKEVLDATRQLAVLCRMDFPLSDGLRSVASDGCRWLTPVANHVAEGDTLGQAVARHPNVFSPFYSAMVAAAEAAESPEHSLAGLSHWLERADRVQRQGRTSLFYPLLLLNAAMLELLLILSVAIPQAVAPLMQLQSPSLWARMLQVLHGSPFVVGFVCTLLAVNAMALRSEVSARILSRLPVFGGLQQLAQEGLWAQALGSLLGAGMPLPLAVEKSVSVVTDAALAKTLRTVPLRMSRGDSLEQALAGTTLSPCLGWSVAAGERGENLAPLMLDAAGAIDRDVDLGTEHALRMMQPWVLSVVGLVVCSVLLTFWAPFYNVVGSLW